MFLGVVSELAGKWQGSRLEHVNSVRWDQLKHMLQSGSKKVLTWAFNLFLLYFMFMRVCVCVYFSQEMGPHSAHYQYNLMPKREWVIYWFLIHFALFNCV